MNSFQERLKDAANRHGLTQADIAKHLDVGRSTVNHWFNGRAGISAGHANKLAQLLGTSMHELLGDESLAEAGESAPQAPPLEKFTLSAFHQQLLRLVSDMGTLSRLSEAEAAALCAKILEIVERDAPA